jgi:hypothetical protein
VPAKAADRELVVPALRRIAGEAPNDSVRAAADAGLEAIDAQSKS